MARRYPQALLLRRRQHDLDTCRGALAVAQRRALEADGRTTDAARALNDIRERRERFCDDQDVALAQEVFTPAALAEAEMDVEFLGRRNTEGQRHLRDLQEAQRTREAELVRCRKALAKALNALELVRRHHKRFLEEERREAEYEEAEEMDVLVLYKVVAQREEQEWLEARARREDELTREFELAFGEHVEDDLEDEFEEDAVPDLDDV